MRSVLNYKLRARRAFLPRRAFTARSISRDAAMAMQKGPFYSRYLWSCIYKEKERSKRNL